jgi:hypothetical protein
MSQPQYPPPYTPDPRIDSDHVRRPDSRPDPRFGATPTPYEPSFHPQVTYQQADGQPAPQPFVMMPAAPPAARRFPRWLVGLGVLSVLMVLGCIGGFVLLGVGAKSVTDTITNDERSASSDAKLGPCTTDPATGFMTASVTITNHGTNQASYLVDVAFQSSNGKQQYDSGVASAQDLAVGQSTNVVAAALRSVKGHFTCKITSVTRI